MLKCFISLIFLSSSILCRAQNSSDKINWPQKYNPAKSKFYVHNEIEINAKPQIVWQYLIDALKWEQWYKGAKKVYLVDTSHKLLQSNSVIKWQTMGLKFTSIIKEFEPYRLLAWESKKKSLQGYHVWLITPTSNGCKVITDESQNGWLTFFEKLFQAKKLKRLHDVWLADLKKKAEGNDSLSKNVNQLTQMERDSLVMHLQSSMQKLNNAINNLTLQQFSFRASENKWTIAECIEHVTLAELQFPEILNKEMQGRANPTFRKKIKVKDDEIRNKMLSRSWKAKSPEIFKPSGKFNNVETALASFNKQRNSTIAYISNTKDDLRNHFWKHPLTGVIDLYQTLLLMSAHLERHIEQIENIKKLHNFPA